MVRTACVQKVKSHQLPLPLEKWLCMSVTILPRKTPRVGQAINGTRSMVVMKQVTETLHAHSTRRGDGELYLIRGRQTHVKKAVARKLSSIPCACASTDRRYPGLLRDKQDHVVLRTPE